MDSPGPAPSGPKGPVLALAYCPLTAPVNGVVLVRGRPVPGGRRSVPKLLVLTGEKRSDQESTACVGAAASLRTSVTLSCHWPLMRGELPASPVVRPA